MEDFSKQFPVLSQQTYLNTAASGLLAKRVYDWRAQHEASFLNHGANYAQRQGLLQGVRRTVAGFIGASENQVSLVPNFSFGYNTLLEGLPKGQKIMLLKNDYPSLRWPVETRGFHVCYAEIDENLEKNIAETAAKHRPDIFVFSIVQWLNGIKINLGFLKHLKLKHPELLLIADGTQYLGTAPFNLSESAIDVLGASGYKWLLAGFGNGFMATKAAAQQRVRPVTIGFNSAENFQSKATGTTFIKHFEPGHQDTFNYGSLQQGIQLLEDVGLADIAVRTRSLSHTAKAEFAARGLLSPAVLGREGHSAIFNIKGGAETFKKLKGLNICCSARGGGIRVSFHFYNSENDLKNLLRAL